MGDLILNGVHYSTSGNLYYPVIYSDTERKIGVWRDNKPLYQITYIFNTPQTVNASPAWFDTGITRNDIEHIVRTDGFRADTNYVLLNGGLNGSNNIVVMQTRPTAITDFKGFTIQYTKTTDTAGSGNWNTDGIPTHHYSTNEQVIGTWLGKPLYEKTWELSTQITCASNTWTYVDGTSIPNHKHNVEVTAMDSNGTVFKCIGANYANDKIGILNTRNTDIGVKWLTLQYTKTTD